jgi:GAF domain-containing protein
VKRSSEEVLAELGRLAANVGLALSPAGHEELLQSIVSAARSLFNAAACSMALLDDSDEELIFHVASGAGAEEIVGMQVGVGQGIAGWVVSSGQPIAIADVRRDPRFAADVAASTGYVPSSILAMPLETERRLLGVIEVLDRRADGREDKRDMELLALFARQAALAIENSRVFADLGRVLLHASARAADDADLRNELDRASAHSPRPDAELAEIASLFARLERAGPDERAIATRVVGEFLRYAETRGRKWAT